MIKIFLIHPQFYNDQNIPHMEQVTSYLQDKNIEAIPTSSSRSLFIKDKTLPSHCIKLHCPLQISRFNRKLDGRDISKSIATSKELDRAIKEETSFPQCLAFLPESIGVSIGGDDPSSWGYLIREMTARPPADSPRTLIPLFALYSQDLRQPPEKQAKPLMVKLIEQSGLNPKDFILNKVLLPIVESWCFLARDLGILAQAHGQNLLLEFNEDNIPTRVVLRDLSTYMDRDKRLSKGLSNSGFPSKKLDPEAITTSTQGYYSLTYDSFLGHHLLDYIAKIAKEEFSIETSELQQACKEKFKQCFPDAEQFFPPTVYYYSKHCIDGYRQDLENTQKLPTWR